MDMRSVLVSNARKRPVGGVKAVLGTGVGIA
jgi:hypothetical protein